MYDCLYSLYGILKFGEYMTVETEDSKGMRGWSKEEGRTDTGETRCDMDLTY